MSKPRVKLPKSAQRHELITIKTLLTHPMESGQRTDRDTGEIIPRFIINRFAAHFEGSLVIDIDMQPGIAADPYFKFQMRVPHSGTFHFTWTDDAGHVYETRKSIEVVSA